MSLKVCPKYLKCPIFQGASGNNKESIYKSVYCVGGEEKYTKCKRYLVSEMIQKAPPEDIMPNSFYSVEDIIDIMKERDLL